MMEARSAQKKAQEESHRALLQLEAAVQDVEEGRDRLKARESEWEW